ncbi:MAG: ferrous iron transporter B [Vulcanimicrobiota bacterium]
MSKLELLFVGLPNVGKSSLINSLTGSVLKVGNWSGTTVEKRSLQWKPEFTQEPITVVDLPGSYSLHATSPEEEITRQVVGESPTDRRRLLVNVVDSGQLERDLYLTLELKELGQPMLVVLNLADEAEKFGIKVDAASLAERLDLPVVSTVGVSRDGAAALATQLALSLPSLEPSPSTPFSSEEPDLKQLENRMREVMELSAATSTCSAEPGRTKLWHRRLDHALLHPFLGPILFVLAMLLVFRFTFLLSDPWITFLGTVQEVLARWVTALPLPALVNSFLAEGVIGGLGTVAAFSPVLFFLYFGMSFLERTGFLPRIAVGTDRVLRSFGLSGRSLVPLLLGFGCNVPALAACRTIDSSSERIRAAIAIPFMSCGARLAVYSLFAAIFFPGREAWVVLGLYLGGIVVGLVSAALFGKRSQSESVHSVIELPPFRLPPLRILVKQAWTRCYRFVQGAGRMVCLTVVVVWAMLHIPHGMQTQVEQSLYGRVSQLAIPIFRPMGVEDPHLVGALIPGIVAKEVVIGSMATSISGLVPLEPLSLSDGISQLGEAGLTALEETGGAILAMVSGLHLDISPNEESTPELMADLATRTTAAGALGYLVFILLYTPCVATVAALRDLVGWRWAGFLVFYQLAVAWVFGVLVYQIARLAGFS